MPNEITCRRCERSLPAEAFAKDKARSTGRRYACRECSAAEFKAWQQTPGYRARLDKQAAQRRADPREAWLRNVFYNAKQRAKAKGIAFTLTKAQLGRMGGENCPLLGTPLSYDNRASTGNAATLDRIDNTKGYVPGNCWVISMLANRIKTNASLEQLETLAMNLRAVLEHIDLEVA